MTIYIAVPLLLLLGVFQAAVVSHLKVWGVFPDLPLLVVVGWGLLRGKREGLVWGFVAGLGVDLLSGAPFGAATLPLMGIGLAAGLGAAAVFRNPLLPPVTVVAATVVYDVAFLLVVGASGGRVEWLPSLVRLILPAALLNALLTPVVVGGMRWLYNRLHREEVRIGV